MTQLPPRFTLEWLMPQEVDLETHAVLYDAEQHPDHVLAMGRGADEAEALLDLWTMLCDRDPPEGAIGLVAEAFTRRTGQGPR